MKGFTTIATLCAAFALSQILTAGAALAECAKDDIACIGANKPPKSSTGGGGMQQKSFTDDKAKK